MLRAPPEVDGGLFQIAMTPQQDLNGAQIRTCFEEMRGKTMPQDVWVYLFLDARLLGSLFAGVARCFRIDRLTTIVPAIAWKQPFAGFSRQAAPVLAQFLQLRRINRLGMSKQALNCLNVFALVDKKGREAVTEVVEAESLTT